MADTNALIAAFSAGIGLLSPVIGYLWRELGRTRRRLDALNARLTSGKSVPPPRPRDDSPLILLVEDNPLDRALFLATVDALDVRVVCVGSAEEALKLRGDQWALIVVDSRLPGLSGPDLVTRLKCPVVLLSAAEDDVLRAQAAQCGADAWLQKRGDINAVRTTIATLIRR